jgi:hypothetical protein
MTIVKLTDSVTQVTKEGLDAAYKVVLDAVSTIPGVTQSERVGTAEKRVSKSQDSFVGIIQGFSPLASTQAVGNLIAEYATRLSEVARYEKPLTENIAAALQSLREDGLGEAIAGLGKVYGGKDVKGNTSPIALGKSSEIELS